MKDYRGAFQPDLRLEDLDHDLLARYGRDVMLANHIHDRSALLPVALMFGKDAQTQVACDEWMSTSPIYNHRNRQFLKIEGEDVSVALKGFQVDIGFREIPLSKLREDIDREFLILSQAHYDRYMLMPDLFSGQEQ